TSRRRPGRTAATRSVRLRTGKSRWRRRSCRIASCPIPDEDLAVRRCRSLLLVLLLAAPVCALAKTDAYGEAFAKADAAFKADNMAEAEREFQRAYQLATDEATKAACLERLPAIYLRLGRHDLAIQYGVHYQEWLQQNRDLRRWREWSVEI